MPQPQPWRLRPMRVLSLWVIGLLAGWVVLRPVIWVVGWQVMRDHQRVLDTFLNSGSDPAAVRAQLAELADSGAQRVADVLTPLVFCLVCALIVLFLVWLWRARANADVLRPGGQRRSPAMVVGSWFIPVVNLWFPKQHLDDIWTASAPDRRLGLLHGYWVAWLAWISWGLVTVVSAFLWGMSQAGALVARGVDVHSNAELTVVTGASETLFWVGAAGDVVGIAAAVLCGLVVRRITGFQDTARAAAARI